MGYEIERKFLIQGSAWKKGATPILYRQAYLCTEESTVRVRIAGDEGFLTIKGPLCGIGRPEFEYPIPVEDAVFMLQTLVVTAIVEKYRYIVTYQGFIWEVDEFIGENLGLVVAEIELSHAEQLFPRPDWVDIEVTQDRRFTNSSLARYPFSQW